MRIKPTGPVATRPVERTWSPRGRRWVKLKPVPPPGWWMRAMSRPPPAPPPSRGPAPGPAPKQLLGGFQPPPLGVPPQVALLQDSQSNGSEGDGGLRRHGETPLPGEGGGNEDCRAFYPNSPSLGYAPLFGPLFVGRGKGRGKILVHGDGIPGPDFPACFLEAVE